MTKTAASKLFIRNAAHEDIPGILALCKRAYRDMPIYTPDYGARADANFLEGQFVALYEDEIIGSCATFIIGGDITLAPHSWVEITGNGFASRHDSDGDYLYGMEVCLDPEYRGWRIGQRLYNERKKLCGYPLDAAIQGADGRTGRLLQHINIIGGSHHTQRGGGEVMNVCYAFLRGGRIHKQDKIHLTPNERFWWNIKGGDNIRAIMTDCGPVGILICYDSEFPELARHLAYQGAQILFVPFCADERQDYYRVRYCAQACAIENQCYVVFSGNVGNLSHVENMDIQLYLDAVRLRIRARRHRSGHCSHYRNNCLGRPQYRSAQRGAQFWHGAEPERPALRSVSINW